MHEPDYARLVAALCDPAAAVPEFLRATGDADLADRFAVYRNNIHVSLVDALAENFPIVRAQVGEEFFHALARSYVQAHKPTHALLTFYGEDFPAFIAGFEACASLPWLHDLARLERAWSASWAARDVPALPVTAVRTLGPEELSKARVQAHPAAQLVRSAWPVADIWEAHQCPQPDLAGIRWRPQDVLLTRPQSQVRLRHLDCAAAQFIAALNAGADIGTAAASAPGLDAGALLAQLFDDGMILEILS